MAPGIVVVVVIGCAVEFTVVVTLVVVVAILPVVVSFSNDVIGVDAVLDPTDGVDIAEVSEGPVCVVIDIDESVLPSKLV